MPSVYFIEARAVTAGLLATLRSQGFEHAMREAAARSGHDPRAPFQADLYAGAGHYDDAYHCASRTGRGSGDGASETERLLRLTLFADACGRHEAAARYGAASIVGRTRADVLDAVGWLHDGCASPAAVIHVLEAWLAIETHDATAWWCLALCLLRDERAEARARYRHALETAWSLDPLVDAGLPLRLALAYREMRDWDAVERVCRAILVRAPGDAEMAWQLSHAQWQRNDAHAAEATMRAADAAAPGNAQVVGAIGFYQNEQARYADAEATLHTALALDPHETGVAVDLADLLLRRDDWTNGWPRFEARLARDDRATNNVMNWIARQCPRWRGEALAGKTLVVHSELGNGDDIQMVRFVPALAARVSKEGGRLVMAVRRALKPLFEPVHDAVLSIEDDPLGDTPGGPHYALPMMSLPLVLGLRPEDVNGAAYLRADEARCAAWRKRIDAATGASARLNIGLVWSGSPTHRRDAKRSIPPTALAPILALPGIAFYPLTPGLQRDIAWMTQQGASMHDFTTQYSAGFGDVAAHVASLDALVTIDSAPLHLAGALGRPVLAMLDHVSHWSWGVAESQSWYDSMTLFRQPKPGAWDDVVERVAARLREM